MVPEKVPNIRLQFRAPFHFFLEEKGFQCGLRLVFARPLTPPPHRTIRYRGLVPTPPPPHHPLSLSNGLGRGSRVLDIVHYTIDKHNGLF